MVNSVVIVSEQWRDSAKQISSVQSLSPILLFATAWTAAHQASLSSVARSCPTLCDPMECSTPGFPVHHQLSELAQTHEFQVTLCYNSLFFPLNFSIVFWKRKKCLSYPPGELRLRSLPTVEDSIPVLAIEWTQDWSDGQLRWKMKGS